MKPTIALLALVTVLVMPLGCVVSREIDGEGSLPTSYVIGGSYEIITPLFLFRVPNTSRSKMRLQPPGNNQKGPDTLAEFERGDPKKWPALVGVVREKTMIKITRRVLIREAGFGDVLYAFCEILDGPYAGHEVDLTFSSKRHVDNRSSVLIPNPDPAVLRDRGK
jgi:hypothetical protein